MQASDILMNAPTATDALRSLYERGKAVNPKLSLTALCTRAGMKSKGYLSDILRGRRTLNRKFAEPLAAALGLKGAAARAFILLADLEQDDLAPKERAKLEERLAVQRRSLAVAHEAMPAELARMAFAFEVYAAFGLYGNAPTRADLLRYFGERQSDALDAALQMLLKHALVEADGERFHAAKTGVIFGPGTGLEHLDFLRSSLRDAERHVHRWFPRRDEAYVESVILSVKRHEFVRLLPLIREKVLEMRSQLDVEDADMLVRFNVQVYPVRDNP